MVAKRQGSREGMEWEVGVSRCKLLYMYKYIFIDQINNKVLLYSTENDSQYSVINHNGKEHLKRIYVEV